MAEEVLSTLTLENDWYIGFIHRQCIVHFPVDTFLGIVIRGESTVSVPDGVTPPTLPEPGLYSQWKDGISTSTLLAEFDGIVEGFNALTVKVGGLDLESIDTIVDSMTTPTFEIYSWQPSTWQMATIQNGSDFVFPNCPPLNFATITTGSLTVATKRISKTLASVPDASVVWFKDSVYPYTSGVIFAKTPTV